MKARRGMMTINRGISSRIKDTSGIEHLLIDALISLALDISPKNPQGALMRVEKDEEGKQFHRILCGIPDNSDRHEVNGIAFLSSPKPKLALLEAIDDGFCIIQETQTDPRTDYMVEHAKNKGINSTAFISIMHWLLIIDLCGNESVFSEEQIELIRTEKERLETEVLPTMLLAKGNGKKENRDALSSLLNEMMHHTRNGLTIIGGFANRINQVAELHPNGNPIANYAGIILSQVSRIEGDLRSLDAIKTALLDIKSNGNTCPLSILNEIRNGGDQPAFEIEAFRHAPEILEHRAKVDAKILKCIFDDLHLKTNAYKSDRPTPISIHICQNGGKKAEILIHSGYFEPIKGESDERMVMLNEISRINKIHFEIYEGMCRLLIPLEG
jgi:hypothetical protein